MMHFQGFKLAYQNGQIDHFMINPEMRDAMNQAIMQDLDKTLGDLQMQQERCPSVP